MKLLEKQDHDTQTSLLEAGCEVFAEKGFRGATIADICERAGVNIAAVNYYFRSKEKLYAEAWRMAFHRSLEAHPPDGGVSAEAPAEQRLAGRIRSAIQRMSDPVNHEFDIAYKERANPTGLLGEVMRESIQPMRREMGAIVRELLGPKAFAQQVELCQMSIIAQCLHSMIDLRHQKMLSESNAPPCHFEFDVKEITDHIVRFSLAGIHQLREQIESGDAVGVE
ncbi:MAG: CerR family C-terminal domain-containing protein [Planctomycetes bacterium]|nr:CerR family C-terminal domain-containing protein [Planctomycetota bacterium]